MAKAYCSTVFQQPAAEVWKIIRDFNNYPVWVGGAGESRIEDGNTGDTVGAVRSVLYQGRRIRQRLLAQSDPERSQTYEFCGPPSLPMTDFRATLRVTPVVDGDRAFVEWWATFDCDAGRSAAGSGNGSNRCAPPWAGPPGSRRNTRKPGVSGHIDGFRADFGIRCLAGMLRRLLHSRAAFGIALPVAGARAANLSDAGVAQW